MSRNSKLLFAIAAATTITAFIGASEAGAAYRCRGAVSGNASALGILGTGSAKARAEARRHWSANAADEYGPRYASFYNARNVRWSCKSGILSPAACVVWANPCRS